MTEGVIIQSAIRGGSWWRVCRCHTSTACNIDGIWLCLLNTGLFSGWRSIRWTFRKHETTHSTRRSAFISAINVHLWAWWVLSLHLPDVLIEHTSQREGFHSEKLWCRQRKWRNEGLHSLHLLCRRDNKSYMINQTDGTFSARLTTWNSSSTEWLDLKVRSTPRTTEKRVEKTSSREQKESFCEVVFSFQRSPLMSNWRPHTARNESFWTVISDFFSAPVTDVKS